jgi:para-nitrobenzyl esterase
MMTTNDSPRLTRRAALLSAGAAAASPLFAPAMAQTRDGARPVVATQYGQVRGRTVGGVQRFLGIRYGADTGPLRFQPPRRPEPWDGVRDAASYGAACPQRSDEPNQDEDCLFLNVWTRRATAGRDVPVLVYFHGGAYATGSGSAPVYDGSSLVERGDVVVVTVNHRLGVLGYGYFNRLGAPEAWADSGNAGQLDLVLALQWVRDNIAAFGGDPNRVTVFGQSGGGAKIATLMAQPKAAGLFHRAWTMSGQQVTASGPLNATERARAVLAAVGVAEGAVAELGTMPVQELVDAQRHPDPILGGGTIYFGPVLDFRSLPRHPFYPDAAPQSNAIPMVLGNTRDETRAFLGNDPKNFELSWAELPDALAPQMRVDILPEHVVARYREIYPDYTPSEVFFAASTAARSWRGQVIEAEERAKADAPSWVYQLDWPTPERDGKLRAPHTLDIPLVFDNTHVEGALSGSGPEARAVAAAMSETLLAFARDGDPNNRTIPDWPQYDLDDRATLIFDTEIAVENDPRGDERRLFATVPYVQPGT